MMTLRQIILITTISTTALATTPASFAAKNNGGFQESGESKRKKFCLDLKFSYNENINYYNEKPKTRSQWKRTADNIKTLAEGNNCSWAG
jgi:hypothetical protein